MLRRADNLDGFSETLAKVRRAVHKIFPRELSPTRLAEKYGADAKKKGAARVAAVAKEAAARQEAGDELLRRQLATINAAMPGAVSPAAIAAADRAAAQSPVTVKVSTARNVAPWIAGGTVAALALMLLGVKRR